MKETFYFSHDYGARTDEKIVKLIQKEGWEGYGLYWAIIEKIYESNGYLEYDCDCIAFDLRTECERIARLVNNYGLFTTSNKKLFSKSVLARLTKRKGKSEKARQSAILRWNKPKKDNANALRTQSEGNAIKESKVKESKVNIISNEIMGNQQKEKKSHSLVDGMIEALKGFNKKQTLDDSMAKNRQYAWNLSKKIKQEFVARTGGEPNEEEIIASLQVIISKADQFQRNKLTSFKYVYYHFNELINTAEKPKGGVTILQ